MSQRFRADIQGIRGIAIALVVLLHAGVTGFQGGFVGVELFFVLSGFVVTKSALTKEPLALANNLKNFFTQRIMRIVPLASIVIVATLFAAYFLLGPAFNTDLIQDAQWSSIFATNLHFIAIGANYFIQGLDQSLLNHYWYLALEQQFYLVFPLVFFGVARFAPERYRIRTLSSIAIVAIAASATWSYYQTLSNPATAYYSPWTRVWEISLGCLIALIPSTFVEKISPTQGTVLSTLGLAAIAAATLWLDASKPYPGVLAWWPALGAGVLLLANPRTLRFGPANWLSLKPLTYLGDISYSLYLWHYIWLMLPDQLVNPIGAEWMPLQIAGALTFAILSHHLIEKPLRNLKLFKSDWISTALVLAVSILLVWNASLIVEQLSLRATS